MFGKIQTAAIAALFATSALAYTPADYDPEAVLITVTVTNTKTWCPCETGLSSWGTWDSTSADPTSWEAWSTANGGGKTTTTSDSWTGFTTTTTWGGYGNYTTSTTTTESTSTLSTTSTTSTSSVSTTTTTTTSAQPTPTTCKQVEWTPGQCQDGSYFKIGDEYIYQSCGKTLINNENYLDDWIEIFCDVTSLFDTSFKATAWDHENNKCYVYTGDEDVKPSGFPGSKNLAAGNVDYNIKFDSEPCALFHH